MLIFIHKIYERRMVEWLTRIENVRAVMIRGIFVQIVAIGRRVITSSNLQSQQRANFAMNAKPKELLEIAASHAR